MKKIFRLIAIRIYKKQYNLLRGRLLVEYELVKGDNTNSLNMLSKLLITGEDHRFYYHIGFDIIAIFRAIRNRMFYNKIEGASTIEQQLVRVLTNNFERTFKRKIQEIFLATTITSFIPKNAIPKIYLNVAYYGTGMDGLSQACLKLGITDRETISIEQAAEIVSMIKYPRPQKLIQKRLAQIQARKQHLIRLYNKQEFFNKYADNIVKSTVGTSLFPSVVMAQMIIASGWGNKSIGNNYFGIKATGKTNEYWKGETKETLSTEYYNNLKSNISTSFRDYDDPIDSIRDHNLLLSNERYNAVHLAQTPRQQAQAIFNAGYATDPKYVDSIMSIINTNNLTELDKQKILIS